MLNDQGPTRPLLTLHVPAGRAGAVGGTKILRINNVNVVLGFKAFGNSLLPQQQLDGAVVLVFFFLCFFGFS